MNTAEFQAWFEQLRADAARMGLTVRATEFLSFVWRLGVAPEVYSVLSWAESSF